jgi:hypothetical protein
MIITGAQFSGGMVISPASQPVVTAGLRMQLDPNNSASYPGSGTTWYDLSGYGADINLVSSPTYTSGTPSYFSFNGTSQYGSGTTAGVLGANTYTKSMWFQLADYGFNNNIVSSDPGGHFTFFSGQNKAFSGHSDWASYNAFSSTSTFSLNTWYYIAVTFNTAVGMKMYINGVLDGTSTYNLNPRPGDGSVGIANFSGSNLLNGRVGHVFCYNTELTALEVLQNYNSTKSVYGL